MAPQLDFSTSHTHSPYCLTVILQPVDHIASVCAASCTHLCIAFFQGFIPNPKLLVFFKLNHSFKCCYEMGLELREELRKVRHISRKIQKFPKLYFLLPHHCQDCLTLDPPDDGSLYSFFTLFSYQQP